MSTIFMQMCEKSASRKICVHPARTDSVLKDGKGEGEEEGKTPY